MEVTPEVRLDQSEAHSGNGGDSGGEGGEGDGGGGNGGGSDGEGGGGLGEGGGGEGDGGGPGGGSESHKSQVFLHLYHQSFRGMSGLQRFFVHLRFGSSAHGGGLGGSGGIGGDDGESGDDGDGGGGEGDGGAAGGCGGQSPQVSLQFSLTFFLSHNFFFLCFWHLFCAHASAHVEEGVQSPHVTSHFVLASLHALEVHVALHLLNFLVHLLTAHTSRHEKGPAPARARPGDLESVEPSRLAPPPGTQQMRSSSTCIAEDLRLDPLLCATRRPWLARVRDRVIRLGLGFSWVRADKRRTWKS